MTPRNGSANAGVSVNLDHLPAPTLVNLAELHLVNCADLRQRRRITMKPLIILTALALDLAQAAFVGSTPDVWAFDLLHHNGRDLRELPLFECKGGSRN